MSATSLPARPSSRFFWAGIIAVAFFAVPLFDPRIFASSSFLPHSFCYVSDKPLIALHLVCDLLIWLSYVAIAITLAYLVRVARRSIPFHWMFLAFGVFIIACGFTHLMEVITLWRPVYWLSGYVKLVTAVASVSTAILLPPLVPRIVALNRAAAVSAQMRQELEVSNHELEAFSYSVSHDLRAPLRAIDGFSMAVLEDYANRLPPEAIEDLQRVRAGAERMSALIDDLLMVSRTTRSEINRQRVNLSEVAEDALTQLRSTDPKRRVEVDIQPNLTVQADPGLMRVLIENLIGNAWKFSGNNPQAHIIFASEQRDNETVFFIRDNGGGFDPAYTNRLFVPFQRLHTSDEFPGTGVGLATAQRIIRRHGGRIWAEAEKNKGATFFFTLPPA
ncbi:MAG TPA: ATP-binding protein, partial [Candidatus Limnocylindrales bacterium]|nr:ATP-binding protein [Candidatus Limnocylindrales bacterium]